MAIKVPLVPITMSASAVNACRTDTLIEQHTMVMDEPLSRAGTDQGPTPLDTLVGALAGCTNVVLNLIAKELKASISDLEIHIESALDVRGILGVEYVNTPLPEIKLRLQFNSDASASDIGTLMAQLPKRCAVAVILRQSGTVITEEWTVNGSLVRT